MTASQFAQSAGWPRRPGTGVTGRALALLGALAVALGAAFVLAPGVLAATAPGGGYAGQKALIRALRTEFTEYWGSGRRAYPPELARLVDYWTRYHVAKAVIAALLLTVLVILGRRLWEALLRAGRLTPARGTALALSVALVAVLAVGSAAVVVANIQGAVAPFSSLISMLPARLARQAAQRRDRPGQAGPGRVPGHRRPDIAHARSDDQRLRPVPRDRGRARRDRGGHLDRHELRFVEKARANAVIRAAHQASAGTGRRFLGFAGPGHARHRRGEPKHRDEPGPRPPERGPG